MRHVPGSRPRDRRPGRRSRRHAAPPAAARGTPRAAPCPACLPCPSRL